MKQADARSEPRDGELKDHEFLVGLGPHGEVPASIGHLDVSDEAAERARTQHFRVALVLHTTKSDWAAQQVAGISETLEQYGASVSIVVDCEYQASRQVEELYALIPTRPDAVISIPVDNLLTADAHREIGRAGVKLILMDNAPTGLRPGKDYVTVVSSDSLGNGQVAAKILSPHVPPGGSIGIVTFGLNFFVANEREIGFRKWLGEQRPDANVKRMQFVDLDTAGDLALDFLAKHPELDALFAVWDEPAMQIVRALRSKGKRIPMATIDLGNEIAIEVANGEFIKGVAAQRPYDLGVAEALATVLALTGHEPPPWIAVPGLAVTRSNLVEAYESVWRRP
ncbi:MAG TPA: substrate-binding domain-containing protein, partial [Candidatus Dormibacteraeota bacterium]